MKEDVLQLAMPQIYNISFFHVRRPLYSLEHLAPRKHLEDLENKEMFIRHTCQRRLCHTWTKTPFLQPFPRRCKINIPSNYVIVP